MNDSVGNVETELMKRHRSVELSESHQRTLERIKTFGCEVIQVTSTDVSQGWSYTVGVYDTCGKPEIITVGLREKTALVLLNEAADRLRQGVNLAEGRHREMVGEVECEFRPVDPKWVRHLMHAASWYYEGADFPVIQAVYPDVQNRFPEDVEFDTYFQQPLMQPNRTMTDVDDDFWASTDPESSLFNWKFSDPPHTRVFVSEAVSSGTETVTYVSMTLRMVRGNFWETLCQAVESRFFYAFTTQSIKIRRSLNSPICRWDGGPNERDRVNLGLDSPMSQKSQPSTHSGDRLEVPGGRFMTDCVACYILSTDIEET